MKNVKKLLIFVAISTFVFASSTRTDALGGAKYWADDYSNIGAFPASVNDHNVAYTNGGNNFTSIFDKDGTTWGFSGGTGNDVANIMWGNGNLGVTFGLNMTPEVEASTGVDAVEAATDMAIGVGMPLAGGDFGFTYNTAGGGSMNVNHRRAQSVWMWDNMVISFSNVGDDDATGVVAGEDCTGAGETAGTNCTLVDAITAGEANETAMDLDIGLYTNSSYDGGTNALFGVEFNYGSSQDAADDTDNAMGITWVFGVESSMTDWATLRIGYSHGYDFQDGGDDGSFTAGLGFNYGSFTLDMALKSANNMLNDPVKYVTGRNDEALGAGWTISYTW